MNAAIFSPVLAGALFAPWLFPVTASAAPLAASSQAWSLSSTLKLVSIEPVDLNEGYAPAPYDVQKSVLALDLGALSPLLALSTGALNTRVASDADGLDDALDRYASASSEIDGLGLSVLGALGPLLSLDLSAIRSYAEVSGQQGAFAANGGSHLAKATIDTALTLPLSINVWDNFAPNTRVIDDLLGITLTFNEQIEHCGADFCELTVNAINIGFDNVALGVGELLGLSGNLLIGHSYASLEAVQAPVPEPSTYAMLLAGLGLVGFATRRRAAS